MERLVQQGVVVELRGFVATFPQDDDISGRVVHARPSELLVQQGHGLVQNLALSFVLELTVKPVHGRQDAAQLLGIKVRED